MEKETRPFISWQLADDFMTAVFEKNGSSNRGCETLFRRTSGK